MISCKNNCYIFLFANSLNIIFLYQMVYDQKSREAFADSVLKYLVAYEFDGLDIDWEYLTQRGGIYADKDNFVELIKVLKQKLEPWHFLLTMAIPLSKELIQTAYDLQKLAPLVTSLCVSLFNDL